MSNEPLKVQVARLEERIVGLDQKIEQHNDVSSLSHATLAAEVRTLSEYIKGTLSRHSEKLDSHQSQIQELKRDRSWVIGIFGVLWAALIAYVNSRFRGGNHV